MPSLIFWSVLVFAQARNPLGEFADYQLNRDSNRTSAAVSSGSLQAVVQERIDDGPDGAGFGIAAHYSFMVRPIGRQEGDNRLFVPDFYFEPQFLDELRATGEYIGAHFKARHLGYASVTNRDGREWMDCDVVRFYDIYDPQSEVRELEITTHIKTEQPVLGAVRLDVYGIYKGVRLKAGFDLTNP
jgi:hypothetical protein